MYKLKFFLLTVAIISHSFLSMAVADTEDDLYYFVLSSDKDGSSGGFYLHFADDFIEGYITPEDGAKMSLYDSASPVVWTLQPGTTQALYVNGLPMIDNRTVIMGFSVPEDGNYTLKMEIRERTNLRSIVLVDKDAGTRTDLLLTDTYKFYSDSVRIYNDRFTLLINYRVVEDLSMFVSGDIVVSGSMRSDGAVHVYADAVDTGKVDIDNTDANTVLMADTIILYSNNTSDGLLRNRNTSGGGVNGIAVAANPNQVIIRKNFADSKWTYLSLPFAVDSVNVRQNGVTLSGGKETPGYWAYGWNNVARADLADPSHPDLWKEITYKNGFSKGAGYQIWYDNGGAGGNVDFVTANAADINNLFGTADKNLSFSKYATSVPWDNPNLGNGWALIGGLYSATFTAKATSVGNYRGTIHYREAKTSQATGSLTTNRFLECVLSKEDESVDLAPYAPFYIQETTNLTPGSTVTGTFTFQTTNGLSIESAQYRSFQDENPGAADQFKFVLSSNRNNTYDRFYLDLDETCSESYRTPEDAMKLSTSNTESPTVWSLLDGKSQPLVLNGLPIREGKNVRIGFSVPEEGDYTFTTKTFFRKHVKNIMVVDNVTGKKIDLLQFPYSFHSGAVDNENNRFELIINASYTDIPAIESGKPYAYVKDHLLIVKNLTDGNTVRVLDLAGRTIASGKAAGKEFSTALGQKGVFIVNVDGEKTTVLKVFNK